MLGVWVYKAKDAKNGYRTGNWLNGAFALGIVVVCGGLRWWYGRLNRRRELKRKFVF